MIKKLFGYILYAISPVRYARSLGVSIGHGCFISTRKWSSEPYLIRIGNNVQITQDVWFHTHGGCHVARREYSDFDVFGRVVIEDWAYIGSGAHIMPGVTIGEGSLIAAGSIVTRSVPPGEVWGGTPAKKICTVEDYIRRNLPYNLNSKKLSAREKKKKLLSLADDRFIKK